ncbi:MAG: hypothetical protein KAH20_14765 [Methylococcales bacterium]|nr:hypothetical protein [Methylococcales bacterium]
MKYHNGICSTVIFCFLFVSSVSTAEILSPSSEWLKSITLLTDRSSPAPTTSVSDISDGILLTYNAPTGGVDVGTSTYQFDFTQTVTEKKGILFDISANIISGTYDNILSIEIIKNNKITKLYSSTENTVSGIRTNNLLTLNAGDVWGIRVVTGNYSLSLGTVGEIRITEHIPDNCAAFYSIEGKLTLPCVSVQDVFGNILYYQANLQRIPTSIPISFKLTNVLKIGNKLDSIDCLATYSDMNSIVDVPCVFVPNASAQIDMFQAKMKVTPLSSPLTFEVTNLNQL